MTTMTKTLPRRYRELGKRQRDPLWVYHRAMRKMVNDVWGSLQRSMAGYTPVSEGERPPPDREGRHGAQ